MQRYVEDVYPGSTGAPHDFGSDRFVVAWEIEATPRAAPDNPGHHRYDVSEASGYPVADAQLLASDLNGERRIRIEIPADIYGERARSLELALHWRLSTRRAFNTLLARGYRVITPYCDAQSGRCFYVLGSET